MEHWLLTRNYTIVPPWEVNIKSYVVNPEHVNAIASSSSGMISNVDAIDANMPYIIESLFDGTVSVRVLSKTKTKRVFVYNKKCPEKRRAVSKQIQEQFFLIIRNVKHKKFNKSELMFLANIYIPLADVILCANNIHPQPMNLFYRKGTEERRCVEILSLEDPTIRKLENQNAAHYVVLDDEEEKQVLKKWGPKENLPRVTSFDAMIKYQGIKSGSIVKNTKQFNSYRIVT